MACIMVLDFRLPLILALSVFNTMGNKGEKYLLFHYSLFFVRVCLLTSLYNVKVTQTKTCSGELITGSRLGPTIVVDLEEGLRVETSSLREMHIECATLFFPINFTEHISLRSFCSKTDCTNIERAGANIKVPLKSKICSFSLMFELQCAEFDT